jgi:putative sterol carrier protein
MPSYPFLSDEWIEAAREIREQYRDQPQPEVEAIRMNQVVTDVPFGGGVVKSHIDTTSGTMEMDLGHLDEPEVTLTLDYATARQIFVNQDRDAAMQAFMAGKIKVQGDMAKLLTMLQAPTAPLAAEAAEKIQEITE